MPTYLIAINDEWVPDLRMDQLRERGRNGRHLGGFAVVDVPDDAAARYWAGRIPRSWHRRSRHSQRRTRRA